jgi:hypothetical protein
VTRRLLFAAIGAGAAFLAWAWLTDGYAAVAAAIVVMALAWLAAAACRVRWVASFGLAGAALIVIAGAWQGIAPALLLPGLAFTLAAWDLADFERRLGFAAPADRATLEQTHLARLGVVLFVGLALSESALLVTGLQINFEWTAALILLGAWGLTVIIAWLLARGSGS